MRPPLVLLTTPRPDSARLERSATRPALETTSAVARVSRFDGRTRIVAVSDDYGWRKTPRLPWTRQIVESLRGDVHEVLLARFFRHARVPLSWIPDVER